MKHLLKLYQARITPTPFLTVLSIILFLSIDCFPFKCLEVKTNRNLVAFFVSWETLLNQWRSYRCPKNQYDIVSWCIYHSFLKYYLRGSSRREGSFSSFSTDATDIRVNSSSRPCLLYEDSINMKVRSPRVAQYERLQPYYTEHCDGTGS